METRLARTHGGTIQDLEEISVAVEDYVKSDTQTARQRLLDRMKQKRSLLESLVPNALERLERRQDLERLQAEHNRKVELFKLYTEVQVEIARKQGDALLASVGINLQTALADFVNQKIEQLTESLEESRSRFLPRIFRERKGLEAYKDDPELYDGARHALDEEMNIYFESANELLRGFIAALRSRVAK